MRIATDLTDSPQEIEAAFEVIFGDIGYIRRVRA